MMDLYASFPADSSARASHSNHSSNTLGLVQLIDGLLQPYNYSPAKEFEGSYLWEKHYDGAGFIFVGLAVGNEIGNVTVGNGHYRGNQVFIASRREVSPDATPQFDEVLTSDDIAAWVLKAEKEASKHQPQAAPYIAA